MFSTTSISSIVSGKRLAISARLKSSSEKKYSGQKTLTIMNFEDETGDITLTSFDDTFEKVKTLEVGKSYNICPVISENYNNTTRLKISTATDFNEINDVRPFIPNIAHFVKLPPNTRTDIEGFVAVCDMQSSSTQNGGTKRKMILYDNSGSMINIVCLGDSAGTFTPPNTFVRLSRGLKTDEETYLNWSVPTEISTKLDIKEVSPKIFKPISEVNNHMEKVTVAGKVIKVEEPVLLTSGSMKVNVWIADASMCIIRAALFNNPCEYEPKIGNIVGFINAKVSDNDQLALTIFDNIITPPHEETIETSLSAFGEDDYNNQFKSLTVAIFDSLSIDDYVNIQYEPENRTRNSVHGYVIKESESFEYSLINESKTLKLLIQFGSDEIKETFMNFINGNDDKIVYIKRPGFNMDKVGEIKIFEDTIYRF